MSGPHDMAGVLHSCALATVDFGDLEACVHVWTVDLDGLPDDFADGLPVGERERAARFSRSDDRQRFVVARRVLRTILGAVVAPDDASEGRHLRLQYGPAGKPYLADDPDLHVNVSHSGRLVMIAVTRSGPVGIDVEAYRPVDHMDAVARAVFTAAERAAVREAPAWQRSEVFFGLWTRKEALLKAMGGGLADLRDPDAASLRHAGAPWHVVDLPAPNGFAAALARPQPVGQLRLWAWSGADGSRHVERRMPPPPVVPPSMGAAP